MNGYVFSFTVLGIFTLIFGIIAMIKVVFSWVYDVNYLRKDVNRIEADLKKVIVEVEWAREVYSSERVRQHIQQHINYQRIKDKKQGVRDDRE